MDPSVAPTPRINKALLPSYVGSTVRLVARVTGKANGVVHVQTSDGGTVQVVLTSNGDEYHIGGITEIIGRVREDETIEEFNNTTFNDNFNMENFDQLIRLTHYFPELFGIGQ
eukprot:TRINITY_DN2533_c0_g1_i1.p1 TRINITY_DN2533_c0_g1~~TRINITY_DN2533_c0_g1_i1.p1  ORF type:complete len:113 (+),score=14.61 TRINITY_DN2533_c0_g1_i1:82-420(+)